MLNIESMKALRSDGIAQAPFLAAQATVALVGNALYETFETTCPMPNVVKSARS